MSLAEIAEGLREADPDRFGAVLVAPAVARAKLWTLYALNIELARAPLQSNEPLIAEMRLQWWIDQLHKSALGMRGADDLLQALAEAWGPATGEFAALAEARRRDCERAPFAGPDEVVAYIRATSVPLMQFAANALNFPAEAKPVLEAQALGLGLANWLAALPALNALGLGFATRASEQIEELAGIGLNLLELARKSRKKVPRSAAPALYAPPQAGRILKLLRQDGEALVPEVSEFRRRFGLGRLALTGRWWV
ncbi:squalene/phytoene synthase family protein [Paracoccus aminophilus]|uniref:Putative phytoene/squalene synthetase n=1 Tax=Paracoccus aminophilus JCM 7686 TaxID=1367847 RepID=S5XN60_PARAH|nr:squalene/phytoene synthase family protein [Paracoccus aminophilus]AGT08739.1 putative phytoene/squalene synthetase [Paracoccus aminophilus JCM 7686]